MSKEIESEEKNLLLRLEQLQKMKKINNLQNKKNVLIEQVKSLNVLMANQTTLRLSEAKIQLWNQKVQKVIPLLHQIFWSFLLKVK